MPQVYNVGCRSWCVTATAWAFIALGLAASVLVLLRYAALVLLMPSAHGMVVPVQTALLLDREAGALAVLGVLSLLLVASGVGLAMRLEWARRVAIGTLGLGIVASLCGLWLPPGLEQAWVGAAPGPAVLPSAWLGALDGAAELLRGAAPWLALGACGLLAWAILALRSPGVRQEFA